MLDAIIIGLSQALLKRIRPILKESCPFKSGWNIEIVPPSTSKHSVAFEMNIPGVQELLKNYLDSPGPHVFAFTSADKKQNAWVDTEIVPYFRFRWLDNSLVQGKQQVSDLIAAIEAINVILVEEEQWHNVVKPHDLTSPLLLPEGQFKVEAQVKGIWDHARRTGYQRIEGFPKVLSSFKQFHEQKREDKKRIWQDKSGHSFDWHGPHHGKATPPRCWKYSYRIPDGFHYDVKSRNAKCTIVGADGHSRSGAYLNIDPHGIIRA